MAQAEENCEIDTSEASDIISELGSPKYSVPRLKIDPEAKLDPNRNRRFSVSAESESTTAVEYVRKVYPKNEETIQRIQQAVSELFLFKGLDEIQQKEIVDAMFEKRVNNGEDIITQGDRGDYFYVIESGCYEVWKRARKTDQPKKVFKYDHRGSFGELALMYNSNRAATVRCVKTGILWAVDRLTFKHIVVRSRLQKQTKYDSFLRKVNLLRAVEPTTRAKIADCLETIEFKRGEYVFHQGDVGDNFYLIESGVAMVCQKFDGCERMIRPLHETDYFGEKALLLNEPRSASIVAWSETLEVSVLETASFLRLLGDAQSIMTRQMKRYRNADANSKIIGLDHDYDYEFDVTVDADDNSEVSDFEVQ